MDSFCGLTYVNLMVEVGGLSNANGGRNARLFPPTMPLLDDDCPPSPCNDAALLAPPPPAAKDKRKELNLCCNPSSLVPLLPLFAAPAVLLCTQYETAFPKSMDQK